MAIFHLSIRTISRAKGHSAVAQVAYDTRCKLTNERTGEKHDWTKQKADLLEWQVIGPKMEPSELARRAELAVEFQQVVHGEAEGSDGSGEVKRGMRAMPVVTVEEGV